MNTDSTLASWKAVVRSNIVRKVSELRADGTVGISAENLFAIVKLPSSGGPTGGNARWAAKQIFKELIRECGLLNTCDAAGRRVEPFVYGLDRL